MSGVRWAYSDNCHWLLIDNVTVGEVEPFFWGILWRAQATTCAAKSKWFFSKLSAQRHLLIGWTYAIWRSYDLQGIDFLDSEHPLRMELAKLCSD